MNFPHVEVFRALSPCSRTSEFCSVRILTGYATLLGTISSIEPAMRILGTVLYGPIFSGISIFNSGRVRLDHKHTNSVRMFAKMPLVSALPKSSVTHSCTPASILPHKTTISHTSKISSLSLPCLHLTTMPLDLLSPKNMLVVSSSRINTLAFLVTMRMYTTDLTTPIRGAEGCRFDGRVSASIQAKGRWRAIVCPPRSYAAGG